MEQLDWTVCEEREGKSGFAGRKKGFAEGRSGVFGQNDPWQLTWLRWGQSL